MADPAVNQADLDLYQAIKADLLSKGMEGKFVLIAGGELVEVYDSYQAAYGAAVAAYRPPFLIKEVLRQERVEKI
jgi:hypothetical protein